MNYTRREFICRTGIAIAALLATRCSPATSSKSDTPRQRLREIWLRLDWLAQETRDNWDNDAQSQQARKQLISDHRAALDELTTAGDLDAAVAEQVQLAFSAAAYHVWRSNAPITCYEAMLVDYTPTSANQLVQQANLLADLAGKSDLDPGTVAQAQAVIQRDMAFLSLSQAETEALYDALYEAAGDGYDFPSLEELDLEISPQAAEAARFLAQLLLEG
jgi:hypothetical protein